MPARLTPDQIRDLLAWYATVESDLPDSAYYRRLSSEVAQARESRVMPRAVLDKLRLLREPRRDAAWNAVSPFRSMGREK